MLSAVFDRPRRNSLALTAVLALLWPAGEAAAWTRTSVSVAEVRADVDASGRALIQLELGLRVHGGWLSRFELERIEGEFGLDPDKPPSLLTEDGRKLKPVAVLGEDGRLVLEFPDKRDAPRRGLHRLQVVYRGRLALAEPTPGGLAHASIALPAWPVDLDAADIWVSAPVGSRFTSTDDPDGDGSVSRTRIERGGRVMLHWHRVLLPRTSSLVADFALRRKPSAPDSAKEAAALRAGDPPSVAIGLALLISAIVALKRLSVHTLARRYSARPLPLFALPTWFVGLLTPALAALGAMAQATRPIAALSLFAAAVALGLHRGFEEAGPTRPVSTSRPRATRYRSTLQLWSAAAWLDATTPLGVCFLCSLYLIAAMRLALGAQPGLWLEGLLLVSPLWLNATRLALPGRHPLNLAPRTALVPVQADSGASLSGADADPQTQDRAA